MQKKIFLYYENVGIHDRTDDEMALELLSYLDESAFDFYYQTFAADGILKPDSKVYITVKKALCDYFVSTEDPKDDIRLTVSVTLNPTDIPESLCKIDHQSILNLAFYKSRRLL